MSFGIIFNGKFIPEFMAKAEKKVLKNGDFYFSKWKSENPKELKKYGGIPLSGLQDMIDEEYVNVILEEKAMTICS